MPQLASNRMTRFRTPDLGSADEEVAHLLQALTQNLDQEICNALQEENNALAERLNISFMQAKKLARAFNDLSS